MPLNNIVDFAACFFFSGREFFMLQTAKHKGEKKENKSKNFQNSGIKKPSH